MPSLLLNYNRQMSSVPPSWVVRGTIGSSLTSIEECMPRKTVSLPPQLSNKTKVKSHKQDVISFQISSVGSQDKYLRSRAYEQSLEINEKKNYRQHWYNSICRQCFIWYQEFKLQKQLQCCYMYRYIIDDSIPSTCFARVRCDHTI